MRIFIVGGTGLVGSRLFKALTARGDEVVLLSRQTDAARRFPEVRVVVGDPSQTGPWMEAVKECDAVVNLVGEGVFNRRWSDDFKQTLVRSRVESTRNVAAALKAAPPRGDGSPRVLVNASAIGIYGPKDEEYLDEASPPGNDFLAKLCVEWEQAAREAEPAARVVIVRVGVVLDKAGGALAKMLLPFKLCAGGPVGSGRQYVSWIHHHDLVGLFLLGLDHSQASGPLNGTAPSPVTNKAFAQSLGRALGRPSFMPTPTFMLRLMLGEVADVVTTGQRVMPRRPLELGYVFKFPDIDGALRDVLS